MSAITASVLTVSDRSFSGEREDVSGPRIIELLNSAGFSLVNYAIVPDDMDKIAAKLREWLQSGTSALIFSTGGTGFAPRDVTPEATKQVIERETPGISEYIRRKSAEIASHAILSRGISGIAGKTLIVNLPGSPKAAAESLTFILHVLPHALALIQDDPEAEKGH